MKWIIDFNALRLFTAAEMNDMQDEALSTCTYVIDTRSPGGCSAALPISQKTER